MADIFISYAREDQEWAEALSKTFEVHGWSTWWDARLSAGERFDDVIERELETTKCIVVLWSNNSIKSTWVKAEANEGLERGILVPVFIEEVKPPLIFRGIHTLRLMDWYNNKISNEIDQLIGDIDRIVPIPNSIDRDKNTVDISIYTSGSAYKVGSFGEARFSNFSRALGREIIKRGFKLISGYGSGMQQDIIQGALEVIFMTQNSDGIAGRIDVNPYPNKYEPSSFRAHRVEIIRKSNFVIFLAGNRINASTNNVENSQGVREEFEILKKLRRIPIPVGATGFASYDIWKEVSRDIDLYYPGQQQIKNKMKKLGDTSLSDIEYLDTIFEIIDEVVHFE